MAFGHREVLNASPRFSRDLFSDYLDPVRLGQEFEEDEDLDGFTLVETSVLHTPLKQEPITMHLDPLLMNIFTEVLRDVLVELKAEDRKKQRTKQHNMTLRELRVQQRQRKSA